MKWLSAGLIFVNLSTVCGLLLGMAGNGLNQRSAILSLISGAAFALAAYLGTSDTATEQNISNSPAGKFSRASPHKRYRHVWLWPMAACFALFALRSFCWLLYIDGEQLRIQSPNNLGDLALRSFLVIGATFTLCRFAIAAPTLATCPSDIVGSPPLSTRGVGSSPS